MYGEQYEHDTAKKSVNPTSCGCQWRRRSRSVIWSLDRPCSTRHCGQRLSHSLAARRGAARLGDSQAVRPGRRPSDVIIGALGLRRRAITAIGRRNYTISRHDVAAYVQHDLSIMFRIRERRWRAAGDRNDLTSRWDWKRLGTATHATPPVYSRPTVSDRTKCLPPCAGWFSTSIPKKIIISQMMRDGHWSASPVTLQQMTAAAAWRLGILSSLLLYFLLSRPPPRWRQ